MPCSAHFHKDNCDESLFGGLNQLNLLFLISITDKKFAPVKLQTVTFISIMSQIGNNFEINVKSADFLNKWEVQLL